MNVTGNFRASKCKRHLDIVLGKMLQPNASTELDKYMPYIRAANVQWRQVDWSDLKEMWFSPNDRRKYTLEDGDLVVLEGGDVGRCAILQDAPNELGFQNSIHRVRARNGTDIRFVYYWMAHLKSFGYLDLVCSKATLAHFTGEKFAESPFPVVDLETQRQIADFLDRETARIDLLIEKKQRLVALLGDHWDRFTFDLFSIDTPTRFNLDKSEWQHQKLKFLSPRVTVGIVVTPAAYYTDDGVPAIRGTNIRAMDLRLDDMVAITDEGHRINRKSAVAEGDVVVVRTGQPGTAAVVPKALDGANCIDVILIKKTKKYLSDLLAHFLNSSAAKAQYSSGSSGAIQQHFNISIASNLVVPVPPLREQERVLTILRQEGQRVRDLTSTLQTSIDRLKEYRAALITAAVTGQIDVTTTPKPATPNPALCAIQEEMGA